MTTETSIMTTFGYADVPVKDRLFLLIPVEGCAYGNPEKGQEMPLTPKSSDFFSEDNGFLEGDRPAVEALSVGDSLKIFDGIAQAQVIVRVA